MKVLLVRPLPDPRRWSMQLYAQELVQGLRKIAGPGDEFLEFPPEPEMQSWSVDLDRPFGRWKRYVQQYFLYGAKLSRQPADLYHITDHGYGNLLPFLRNKKVVVTFHDALLMNLANGSIPVSFRPCRSILAQHYALRCMRRADGVISVSRFSKAEFLKFCPLEEQKVSTIYEGIADIFRKRASEEEKKAFRERWQLRGSVVLFPGRTDPHKNMEGIIRAAGHLMKKFSHPVTLVKVGSDLTPSQKSLLKALGLESHFRFLGDVPSSDLPLLYQASDVLLFLSFYEGFGFPVLEAMASGIPVLISNRGSLPEVGGGACPDVDPQDEDSVVRALFRILTDLDYRKALIEKGARRASEFSWEKAARETLNFYRRILAANPAAKECR